MRSATPGPNGARYAGPEKGKLRQKKAFETWSEDRFEAEHNEWKEGGRGRKNEEKKNLWGVAVREGRRPEFLSRVGRDYGVNRREKQLLVLKKRKRGDVFRPKGRDNNVNQSAAEHSKRRNDHSGEMPEFLMTAKKRESRIRRLTTR